MRKFSEVLEEYLDQRERLNGDYYDNMPIYLRGDAREDLENLANELDEIVEKVQNAGA
jgi:hypothetical protein